MAFSVEKFKANIFGDLARSYMFRVEFTGLPTSVAFAAGGQQESLFVESTSLPGKTIEVVDAAFMGQQLKLAGNVTYPDWNVTFRMDDVYNIYSGFRNWMDLIRPTTGDKVGTMTSPSEYKGILTFRQLSSQGDVMGTVKLFGAFPNVLGEIALDTKTSDIQTFQVTFSYDYHIWGSGDEEVAPQTSGLR